MPFAKNFAWGVASSAYQIEGAPCADGKGLSVWDMFCRKKGTIWMNQNGDVACDHYHRWREDIQLMRELGIRHYRFSVSWPRVLPQGTGQVNAKGLDFYSALVDEMLAAGIEPWLTLYHWDFPLDLYRRGGWLNRESADWFAEYASVLTHALSDRVQHWITLNEPQCFIEMGLHSGEHAPGDKLPFSEVLRATHHSLLAHGKAVGAIRAAAKKVPSIGVSMVGCVSIPETESAADIEAARRAMFQTTRGTVFTLAWWTDPIVFGCYPKEGLEIHAEVMPKIEQGDMEIIGEKIDFLGANVYHGTTFRAGIPGKPELVPLPPGYPKTTQSFWPITPEALRWGPKFMHDRYELPIVITENGHQNADVISLDGKVHDPQRIDFLHRYLLELRRAVDEGVPVMGYFHWCFTDNFEWAMGDAIRVGLVYTHYPNQQRIPKDSAYWYQAVMAVNGANL